MRATNTNTHTQRTRALYPHLLGLHVHRDQVLQDPLYAALMEAELPLQAHGPELVELAEAPERLVATWLSFVVLMAALVVLLPFT